MIILKNNLKWARPLSPLRLEEVDGLALHNVAHPTWGMEETHEEHLSKGWAGFGYGWFVPFNGQVVEGRGFNYGAHCLGHNGHLLSICFQGDYDNKTKSMPKAQFEAGVELIKYVKSKVPTVKIVDGHKRWRPTACPGRYFPLEAMIKVSTETEGQRIAKILSNRGLTADEKYWADVLDGKEAVKAEYLKTMFSRMIGQFRL